MVRVSRLVSSLLFMQMLFLPGCTKIVDWGKETLNQGDEVALSVANARSYVRSITVYDQFKTVGMFDALLLSDEVRGAYATLVLHKRAVPIANEQAFIERQLAENNDTISFYLLNRYEEDLDRVDAPWALFLMVGSKKFVPIVLKPVELTSEYQYIFGKVFNRFKQAYLVQFSAFDDQGNRIVTTQEPLQLCFRSLTKQTCLSWGDTKKPAAKPHKKKRKKEKKKKGV